MDPFVQQILKIFTHNPFDSFNHKQIASRLGIRDKAGRQAIIAAMHQLAKEELLVDEGHQSRYRINSAKISPDMLPSNQVEGTIDMKQTGKAYVILPDDQAEDIQIAAGNTGHALHGDTVRVMLFPQRKMRKPEGKVVEVVRRAKTRFVGCIQLQKQYAFMVCDSRTMPVDFFIPLADLGGATDGEKVLVELVEWPDRMNNPVGKVIKRIGTPGDNNVEMQSILAEYDFPLDFPEAAEQEANAIQEPCESDFAGRRDCRQAFTLTIDPADAKDFDDAISLIEVRNNDKTCYEVGVHIADVSHYVHPGSAIDQEAYTRGTSVYLVDRTIPMLPERLCNQICSLRPNEDKLCFSVIITMDENANVTDSWMGKSVIRSKHRLAYEQAQAIIDQNNNLEVDSKVEIPADPQLKDSILILHKLASTMRDRRYNDGAINFESQEVKFQLDENAKPIGVYIKEQREANWLIEEFMLLANRLVAERIGAGKPHNTAKGKRDSEKSTGKTFVYRVHDEPNPEKLGTFVEFVGKLGYSIKTSSRKTLAKSYNALFEKVAGRGEEYMIDSIAIRTMSKAYYSTENIGHYGLGFRYYTHFTSPIRRYPDLMTHRLLELYLNGGQSVSADTYEAYCQHCSQMEKKAADAERSSVKYKQAEFLSDQIGKVFAAHVSGVSKWGIYAEIEGNKCEGMIPIGSLRDDYYMLDEDNYQVIGHRTGHCYKLGDAVQIVVKKVDMLKKQIDFELVTSDMSLHKDSDIAPSKSKSTKKRRDNAGKKSNKQSANAKSGKQQRKSHKAKQ